MGFQKNLFLCPSLVAILLLPLITAAATVPNCGLQAQKNSLSASLCHHHAHHGKGKHHGGGGCGCSPSTPSHGGGGGHHEPNPPPLVPSPPYTPTPSTPSSPPYTPTPSSPPCTPTPSTPSTPGGGGGYYGSPPPTTPVYFPPPTPTITPITPITPSPPVPIDPGSGPFPCTYWGSHPGLIFGLLGWWGTIGGIFGGAGGALPGTLPGLGTSPTAFSLQQALLNPQQNGYGALYREATASYLNALAAPRRFPFTTSHVRDAFASALTSEKAAASQARIFRLANEGRLKLVR